MTKRKLINRNGRYYINDERDILGISTETFMMLERNGFEIKKTAKITAFLSGSILPIRGKRLC